MKTDKKKWYKQFWPWFVMALPLTAVIGAVNLLITSIENQPDMVVDDYYKKGKGINEDLSLIKEAKRLNISAELTQIENELIIILPKREDRSSISISLYHPTLAARDISTLLTADGKGAYHLITDEPLTGKWRLRIEPFDKMWRLEKVIHLPKEYIQIL